MITACQATIVNNGHSGVQGISTNVALPKGGLLGYNVYFYEEQDPEILLKMRAESIDCLF